MKITSLLALGAAIVPILAGAQGAARPDSASSDTGYVVYHDSPISFPLFFGLRTPAYNRIDGLALRWGPKLSLGDDMFEADGIVTYRSNLGKVDPSLKMRFAPLRDASLELVAERSTFSNEEWIRDEVINSLSTFAYGTDARNHYRADRLLAKGNFLTHPAMGEVEFSAGLQSEHAWSTGSTGVSPKAPWSIFGRTSTEKMKRPNPAVLRGTIFSALGSAAFQFDQNNVNAEGALTLERSFDAPSSENFTQAVFNLKGGFPALADHTFAFRAHAIGTSSSKTPPQRYSYLGGASTLPTMELLEQGGDRLLFVDGRYSIPLHFVALPVVGNPIIGIHYAAGSAGVGKLPKLTQNIGGFVGVKFLSIDYLYDPASHKSAFSFGLSLSQ